MSIAESLYLLSTLEEQTEEVKSLIRLIAESDFPDDDTDWADARLAELGKEAKEVAHLVNQYHISVGAYDHQ